MKTLCKFGVSGILIVMWLFVMFWAAESGRLRNAERTKEKQRTEQIEEENRMLRAKCDGTWRMGYVNE